MLRALSPQQLVEWRAALDWLGLDDSWAQTGEVIAAIENEGNRNRMAKAGKQLREADLVNPLARVPLVRNDDGTPRVPMGDHEKPPSGRQLDTLEQTLAARYTQQRRP